MTLETDLGLIKNSVAELDRANRVLQEALTMWSESVTDMHRAEISVRTAHRGVLKAQNMLTVAINNNLGEELEKLAKSRKS